MNDRLAFSLTEPGQFVVGCNYWASHAGTRMWTDWQADTVAKDFELLAGGGLQTMRVFPLWPDFQPIHLLRGGAGSPREVRFGELPLPETSAGQAGMDEVMLERFAFLADCAQKNGIKLIVGLLTGWMSGRLYVPPALEGLNVITDPFAMQWELRFMRHFVQRFKHHPAIAAWDLGNECNCMAVVPSRAAAWTWTAAITNAIRAEDRSRPVVSGMHSLLPDMNATWAIQDQGELTDVLTTHPYPYFTPYADQDPVDTIRTILHSTSESRFYGDIGGRPCIAEELGTLGPVLASETIAANFIRSCLYSLWANDCHGLLWWCAFDQHELLHAPYDWNACERELGLIRVDGTAKPVLAELGKFRQFLNQLPFDKLPPRLTEAVCIITHEQDTWAAAYSAFVLAKQAGFDLTYRFSDQPLPDAPVYILPSIGGQAGISRRHFLSLLEKVKQGAVLYVSHKDGLLSPLNQPFGFEPQTRSRRTSPVTFQLDGIDLTLPAPVKMTLKTTGAQTLAREEDGNPVFTCAQFGQGKIYFLSLPLEDACSHTPGIFQAKDNPLWHIYQRVAAEALDQRIVRKSNPEIGVTEHVLSENQRVVVLVNYSPDAQVDTLKITEGWSVSRTFPTAITLSASVALPGNDGLVLLLEKATE